jgi:hypothetical protein
MTVLVRSDTIRADLYFSLISSLSGFFQTPGRLCISHRPGPKSSYVLESLKYFSIYIARIFGSSGIRIFTRRNLGGIFKIRLHWLRKNIDHGAGVVACVDATSSHKNQKLL